MNELLELGKLIFYVAGVALASGWVVTALTQLLKWKLISIPATKYPSAVAGVLSFLLAIPAVYLTGLVEIAGWVSYAVIAVASLFVATQTYDTIKKTIEQIKSANETK